MLFENKTKDAVKARELEAKPPKKYIWSTIKPTQEINMDKEYGLRLGLTPVNKDKTPEDPETTDDPIDDWKEEILAVKGVGAKTAEDIINDFPTRESLIEAVNKNEHLSMKDDVADHFIEKYTEDDTDEGDN